MYQSALRDGAVNVYRGRLLLIGQDRAGKTSLKKSLLGLPFKSKERSTEGIEVDPSIFEVDRDEVKNWQPIDESKRGLLGCSKGVAEMMVERLFIPAGPELVREENRKDVGNTDGEKEDDSFLHQVCLLLIFTLTMYFYQNHPHAIKKKAFTVRLFAESNSFMHMCCWH